ncbi:hypothetical protein LX32DRAFT_605736, partial [Colletotrichum zoysiae]
ETTNLPGNPAYNASRTAVMDLFGHLLFSTVYFLVPGWAFTEVSGSKPGAEKSVAA